MSFRFFDSRHLFQSIKVPLSTPVASKSTLYKKRHFNPNLELQRSLILDFFACWEVWPTYAYGPCWILSEYTSPTAGLFQEYDPWTVFQGVWRILLRASWEEKAAWTPCQSNHRRLSDAFCKKYCNCMQPYSEWLYVNKRYQSSWDRTMDIFSCFSCWIFFFVRLSSIRRSVTILKQGFRTVLHL